MNDTNSVIVEAWNTVLDQKFCRFKHLIVEGLAQHSDASPCGSALLQATFRSAPILPG